MNNAALSRLREDIRLTFNPLPWARFQEPLFGKRALSHYNEVDQGTINKICWTILLSDNDGNVNERR